MCGPIQAFFLLSEVENPYTAEVECEGSLVYVTLVSSQGL
jgi:hypothetical protein